MKYLLFIKKLYNHKMKIDCILIIGIFILFIVLLLRSTGMYPVVFADEYSYSKFSRLIPFSEAPYPNYLYFYIYSFSKMCNEGFLHCVRIMNITFFLLSAPFIYSIAKRTCPEIIALLITLIALAGPINSYTIYFIPESLYFLCFWIITWIVLNENYFFDYKFWILTGVIVGISALVKPHALFLLMPIVLYIIIHNFKSEKKWLINSLMKPSYRRKLTIVSSLL